LAYKIHYLKTSEISMFRATKKTHCTFSNWQCVRGDYRNKLLCFTDFEYSYPST